MNAIDSNDTSLKPLVGTDGDPVFDEAWQAQALAMADSLVTSGLFSASNWSEALGQSLKESEHRADIDSQHTYYCCVLKTLEQLIQNHSDIDAKLIDRKRDDWEQAYLRTPHGQGVTLDKKLC